MTVDRRGSCHRQNVNYRLYRLINKLSKNIGMNNRSWYNRVFLIYIQILINSMLARGVYLPCRELNVTYVERQISSIGKTSNVTYVGKMSTTKTQRNL